MKKIICQLFVCIVLIVPLFSQEKFNFVGNHYVTNDYQTIDFLDKTIKFELEENVLSAHWIEPGVYEYNVEKKDGIFYLNILMGSKINSYLMLISEQILLLFDGDNKNPCFFGYYSFNKIEGLFNLEKEWIYASSQLTEKGYIYGVNNLSNIKLKEPWVEGVAGYGIGEYIVINASARNIYFVSGYLSYEKPYLWKQNSRPKILEISFPENKLKQAFEVTLNDSPNPQLIDLKYGVAGVINKGSFKIKIIDVYKGSKYEDTCINGILLNALNVIR